MLFHKGTQVKNSNLESAMKNTQIDPEINVLEDSRDKVQFRTVLGFRPGFVYNRQQFQ